MNTQLKKAIIDYIFSNLDEFQIVNSCKEEFRQYIYTEKGDYCIGGEVVSDFIFDVIRLIKL